MLWSRSNLFDFKNYGHFVLKITKVTWNVNVNSVQSMSSFSIIPPTETYLLMDKVVKFNRSYGVVTPKIMLYYKCLAWLKRKTLIKMYSWEYNLLSKKCNKISVWILKRWGCLQKPKLTFIVTMATRITFNNNIIIFHFELRYWKSWKVIKWEGIHSVCLVA